MSKENGESKSIKLGEYYQSTFCSCGCQLDKDSNLDNIQHNHGYEFIFEGEIDKEIQEVWQCIITDNVIQPNLTFNQLRPGGQATTIDTQGNIRNLMVMDVDLDHYLSFTWLDQEIISFSLSEFNDQTLIILTVWLPDIDEATPQNLYTWVRGLKNIEASLKKLDVEISNQERKIILGELEKLVNDTQKEVTFET